MVLVSQILATPILAEVARFISEDEYHGEQILGDPGKVEHFYGSAGPLSMQAEFMKRQDSRTRALARYMKRWDACFAERDDPSNAVDPFPFLFA